METKQRPHGKTIKVSRPLKVGIFASELVEYAEKCEQNE